jgi:uncharacterized coiled-coil protein SlyX
MVLIETLNHFILTHKQTTSKLQANYKQTTSKLQATTKT